MTSKFSLKIITLLIAATILYIMSDCYLFNNVTLMVFNNIFINQCDDNVYPHTYYRKQLHYDNDTYYVYLIQIGQIYSKDLSPSEIEEFSNNIAQDLLWYHRPLNQSAGHSVYRKKLFNLYYQDFHHRSTIQCYSENKTESIDFFKFIQYDHLSTNNSKATPINWYKLLPINNVLNNSYYTSSSSQQIKANINIQNDEYHIPTLYTYTLSVDSSGYLPSLELRFGEIINSEQHEEMKHLLLNKNQKHLLWAGEFWYIYDYKYKKYVLLIDNASGHWKPKANEIPDYLDELMIASLFPNYNLSGYNSSYNRYHYVHFYRPLVFVGYHDYPWHELKKMLFPVVGEINALYKQRAYRKWQSFINETMRGIMKMKRMKRFFKRMKEKQNN